MPASPDANLAARSLAENARVRGGKIGLTIAEGDGGDALSVTFSELERATLRLAAGLGSLGLPPGARVVIRMGNEVDTILLFFASIAAGLVAVPTSPMLTPGEAAFVVDDAEAAAVVLGREAEAEAPFFPNARVILPADLRLLKAASPLAAFAPVRPDDPAYLVYTSGTTGRPKGVLHAHRVIDGRKPMRDDWLALREDDVMLHAGAFNWTYTLGVGLLDPFACGASAVLARGVTEPAAWPRLIQRFGVTVFAAVPGVYRQILKRGWEGLALPTLRHGVTAGEALPPALRDEWRARTGVELYEAFGMSEISTFVSSSPTTPVRPGSPGRPQRGRRIAALGVEGGAEPVAQGESGLLAVHRSDPGLMLGYWRRPDEDAFRGDWFVSGDLVSFDAENYLWHHGRADDVMNALGYRVSPAEVEAALAEAEGVADVGVTEWRARDDLTLIAAFVVLKEGAVADEAALAARCAAKLAPYKRPKAFHFVRALPRSANGKLQRRRLAETL